MVYPVAHATIFRLRAQPSVLIIALGTQIGRRTGSGNRHLSA
jgi:hypothetical protein